MSRYLSLEFDGMEQMIRDLEAMGNDVDKVVEKALIKSANYVTERVKQEISVYEKHTGKLEESLVENEVVKWYGDIASINVGFDYNISYHSIFLMITGTPYLQPNMNLYNAMYGSKTKKEVEKIQRDIFNELLRRNL